MGRGSCASLVLFIKQQQKYLISYIQRRKQLFRKQHNYVFSFLSLLHNVIYIYIVLLLSLCSSPTSSAWHFVCIFFHNFLQIFTCRIFFSCSHCLMSLLLPLLLDFVVVVLGGCVDCGLGN